MPKKRSFISLLQQKIVLKHASHTLRVNLIMLKDHPFISSKFQDIWTSEHLKLTLRHFKIFHHLNLFKIMYLNNIFQGNMQRHYKVKENSKKVGFYYNKKWHAWIWILLIRRWSNTTLCDSNSNKADKSKELAVSLIFFNFTTHQIFWA